MAPQLGASSYCGCGEGRQSHWLSCSNQIFIVRLCLHQPFRLGGTTHCPPGFRNVIQVIFVNKFHDHISYSGAYCNRHPFLIVSGWQD